MKRKIFIGSSSEGLKTAKLLKEIIDAQLGDWVEPEIWNEGDVFSLNKSALESLVRASRRYDYGILVASRDDLSIKRFRPQSSMRDNVLFEIGLFLGSMGLQRAFLITHTKNALPTDYSGITVIKYNKKDLEAKVAKLVDEIQKTKNSFNLRPLPATALAYGYYQNFIVKFSEKYIKQNPDFKFKILIPRNISDVYAQKSKYLSGHPSSETEGDRPKAYLYDNEKDKFWDIPTTLQIINDLVNLFVPPAELGITPDREEWIQHELRNFTGTLEILIKKQEVYMDHYSIEYL